MPVTTVLFSSLTQNMVLIVKAHALTIQNLAFFIASKRVLLKEKHDAIMIIFQSKKIEFKNANDFLSIAQFCFTFHLHTDLATKFPDLNK